MANKWAVQNGNWSDGSTWNDGVVPTADDDVYANGKSIIIDIGEISANLITNKLCWDTSISGGSFSKTLDSTHKSIIINSSIEAYQSSDCVNITVTSGVSGCSIIVNGEYLIGNTGKYALKHNLGNNNENFLTEIINANILDLGLNVYNSASQYGEITVNGNVVNNKNQAIFFYSSYCSCTIVINGNCVNNSLNQPLLNATNGRTQPTLTINGSAAIMNFNYLATGYAFMGGRTIVLNGNFRLSKAGLLFAPYSGTEFYVLFSRESTIEFLNTDVDYQVFTPIESPNLNYPIENQVKKDVVYGYLKDKIGTYNPSLPQESTVLKDVHYGDNQVGTLEVIALSGATAQADQIAVVNLTEQDVNRVKNCATVSTVQKCFEDFKE